MHPAMHTQGGGKAWSLALFHSGQALEDVTVSKSPEVHLTCQTSAHWAVAFPAVGDPNREGGAASHGSTSLNQKATRRLPSPLPPSLLRICHLGHGSEVSQQSTFCEV